MGVFCPVVESTLGLLACVIADYLHRCSVRPKAVCHILVWITVSLHRLSQKLKRSFAISLLCDKHFKDFSFMINGSPAVVHLAVDPHDLPQWRCHLHCGIRAPMLIASC
jgi:hypothetical protein